MQKVIGLLLLAGGLFVVAAGLLFYGIAGRRRRVIYAAAASLLLSGLVAGGAVYQTGKNTYRRVVKAVRPRTGKEIYTALFGPALPGCVRVLHYQDQVVPRLDCCIWLEFITCPAEIKRVLAADTAFRAISQAGPTPLPDAAKYSPLPIWWQPGKLGPKAVLLREYQVNNPTRDQLLFFSPDSTHAYYCDMAD